MNMYRLYRFLTNNGKALLLRILNKRCQKGKEIPERLGEKKGIAGIDRPQGKLVWVHAASVGEAQSALILIKTLLELSPQIHILITTGTVTSAKLMAQKLPARAFHQFYPLDHPQWVSTFIDYWKPDIVLWMESELWPNMLNLIEERNIPAAIINGKMSEKSFSLWCFTRPMAHKILSAFPLILTQTEEDAERYIKLGAKKAVSTGNLKYSAEPLEYDPKSLEELKQATNNRKLWLFSSTHQGEEEMACRVHRIVKKQIPNLLTIIVPRHPERRDEIISACAKYNDLNICSRSRNTAKAKGKGSSSDPKKYNLPKDNDDIYVADTLGELGIFYRLSPLACIGRSFSNDGGGGHNPLEAAQLGCAVLHGPRVQNLQQIYDDMSRHNACTQIDDESNMAKTIINLLTNPPNLEDMRKNSLTYAQKENNVIRKVIKEISPLFEQAGIDLHPSFADNRSTIISGAKAN